MNPRLEEFLGVRGARYERIEHPEAFTAQEEAGAAHVSGWSWAKVVVVKTPEGLALGVRVSPPPRARRARASR